MFFWELTEGTFRRWPSDFQPDCGFADKMQQEFQSRNAVCRIPPQAVHLELTSRCDLRCIMCYNTYVQRHRCDMPASSVIGIVHELNVRRVHLQGIGEPLLHPDVIPVVSQLTKEGCYVSLTTNGVHLDGCMLEQLTAAGLRKLVVSLDSVVPEILSEIRGVPDPKNLIENVLHVLSKCRDRLWCEVNIVFFPEHVAATKQTIGFLLGCGPPRAITLIHQQYSSYRDKMPMCDHMPADEMAKLFGLEAAECARRGVILDLLAPRRAPDIRRCLWPWNSLFVLADGRVTPCCCLLDVELGNVMKDSALSVWNGVRYRQLREIMHGPDVPAMCDGCNYL